MPFDTIKQGITALQQQMHQECQAEENVIYLPLLGKRIASSEARTEDLETSIRDFSADNYPKRVCALFGDGGSGKSAFLKQFTLKLLNEYSPEKPIPLFVSLPLLNDPIHFVVEETLRKIGFSEAQIAELKTDHSFIFILDGYYEIHQLQNLYVSNRLSEWNAKTIISCRSQYLYNKEHPNLYFMPLENEREQPHLLQTLYVAPFNQDQINHYLESYNNSSNVALNYEEVIAIPGLKDLITTPFLLKLTVEALPEILVRYTTLSQQERQQLTQTDLYKSFVSRWFERQEKKLKDSGRITEDMPDQKPIFWRYCQSLALEMHKHNLSWLSVEDEKFSVYFENDAETEILRSACPIKKTADKIGFWHQSLGMHFVAQTIYQESLSSTNTETQLQISAIEEVEQERPQGTIHLRLVTDDPSALYNLADEVSRDERYKAWLFDVIEHSKTNENYAVGAANAISALNAARVSFSERNFKGIRIPYANLGGAIFDRTNLERADLSFSFLKGTWLNNAILTKAIMKGVNFNEQVSIPIRDDVTCCCYSSDGRFILVAREMWLTLYYALTLKQVRSFDGHTATIHSVAFNVGGDLIVSGSGFEWGDATDNTVRIWDIKSGKEVKRFEEHKKAVKSVAFSPDNKFVASGSWDGHLLLWDIQNGTSFTFSGHTEAVEGVVFSLDSGLLVSGSYDKSIRVWDVNRQEQIKQFGGYDVSSLAISPDNRLIASGGRGRNVHIWDMQTKRLYFPPLEGHNGVITSVAFSPNGQWVASGSKDSSIKIWDLSTGKLFINSLKGNQLPVTSVAFHPNSQFIISGSGTCTKEESNDIDVHVWDLKREELNLAFSSKRTTFGFVSSLACSPDGKFIVSGIDGGTGGKGSIQLWSAKNGERYFELVGHPGNIHCVAWSSDGRWIASGGFDMDYDDIESEHTNADTDIRLWDAKIGKLIKQLGQYSISEDTIEGHALAVTALAFSPYNQFLASSSDDDSIQLRHIESGAICRIFSNFEMTAARHHAQKPVGIKSIVYSNDGELIAAAGADGVIRLWEVSSQREKKQLVGHKEEVIAVSFSNDNTLLVSASYDDTIRIWRVETGAQLSVLMQYNVKWGLGGFASKIRYTTCVVFASDGRYIVTGYNGLLAIRDIETNEVKFSVTLSTPVTALSWFGQFLVVGQGKTAAISYWKYENIQLTLRWSTDRETLSAENSNIQDALELSEVNSGLLVQHGAIKSLDEFNIRIQERKFISMTPQEIAKKLLRDSTDRNIDADGLYYSLIKKSIRLKVHLAQDRNGNTALHIAIITGQIAKVLMLLQTVEQKDEKTTRALDIPNNQNKIPLQLLSEMRIFSLEIKELIQKIVHRNIYHRVKSSSEVNQMRNARAPTTFSSIANEQAVEVGMVPMHRQDEAMMHQALISMINESASSRVAQQNYNMSPHETESGLNANIPLTRDQLIRTLAMQYAQYGEDANNPNIATTIMQLGLAFKEEGDIANAKACFEKSLSMLKVLGYPENDVASVSGSSNTAFTSRTIADNNEKISAANPNNSLLQACTEVAVKLGASLWENRYTLFATAAVISVTAVAGQRYFDNTKTNKYFFR